MFVDELVPGLSKRNYDFSKAMTDVQFAFAASERVNIELYKQNKKLRELVADMWRFTGAACKKYPRLFDPAAQGGQMVQLNALDSFEQRMQALGIEVPE